MIEGINAVVFYCVISLCSFSSVGEGGRPHCIFACQGSPVEGWRKWAIETRGAEATVSLLNRKLHNICSLALREGVDSQLCVSECVFIQAGPTSRQALWHSPSPPKIFEICIFNHSNFPFPPTRFSHMWLIKSSFELHCCWGSNMRAVLRNESKSCTQLTSAVWQTL